MEGGVGVAEVGATSGGGEVSLGACSMLVGSSS
jgi:hypothetical protein